MELSAGDPGRIRTCDLQLRRLLLYPLSYGAVRRFSPTKLKMPLSGEGGVATYPTALARSRAVSGR
jgi:hypothetical protein